MSRVAALFVDPNGVYAGLPDVDVWDEARDARLYAGPWPVVAHPPCSRWSKMGTCRGYYDGEDGGCFDAALSAVRTWSGVLEHPAHTLAWKRYGLARPAGAGWTRSLMDDGWTCEVDQRNYGLPFRKPTWLYYVGPEPPNLVHNRGPIGAINSRGNIATANNHHSERERTPPAFRDVLLNMARSATGSPDAETSEATR